jgi:2-dehydro-3-deoxygluconokinase
MTRVLCVGECMIELTHLDPLTLRLGFAGDTYNTAVYLRRVATQLGIDAEVAYLTGLGDDEYSEAMRAEWRDEGIVDRSLLAAGRLPGLYAIKTAQDGERRFAYWREHSAAREVLSRGDLCAHLEGDVIHLSGITLQLMSASSREALLACLHERRSRGARVSFDTNYRPRGWRSSREAAEAITSACAVADIVLASREDEELLYGEQSATAGVRRLLDLGAREVVLRDGPAGAYVGIADDVARVPATPVNRVVDTTAAGDAFAGGYLAARLAGDQPEAAAALGNAVAATVIQHPGAITPRSIRPVGPPTAASTSH